MGCYLPGEPHLTEVNFFETPRSVEVLSGAENTDDLFIRLSVLTNVPLEPGQALLLMTRSARWRTDRCSDLKEGAFRDEVLQEAVAL